MSSSSASTSEEAARTAAQRAALESLRVRHPELFTMVVDPACMSQMKGRFGIDLTQEGLFEVIMRPNAKIMCSVTISKMNLVKDFCEKLDLDFDEIADTWGMRPYFPGNPATTGQHEKILIKKLLDVINNLHRLKTRTQKVAEHPAGSSSSASGGGSSSSGSIGNGVNVLMRRTLVVRPPNSSSSSSSASGGGGSVLDRHAGLQSLLNRMRRLSTAPRPTAPPKIDKYFRPLVPSSSNSSSSGGGGSSAAASSSSMYNELVGVSPGASVPFQRRITGRIASYPNVPNASSSSSMGASSSSSAMYVPPKPVNRNNVPPKPVNRNSARIRDSLITAVEDNRINDVAVLLEEGANANTRNSAGVTVLNIAQQLGYPEIVHLLQEHGATDTPNASSSSSAGGGGSMRHRKRSQRRRKSTRSTRRQH